MKQDVEMRNGGYYIAGKRVSLDSVVYAHRRGQSPKSIQTSFPTLTLAEVTAGLAFYFENREAVDKSILEDEIAADEDARRDAQANPEWYEKMRLARETFRKKRLEKV